MSTRVACLGEAMVELSLDDATPDVARLGIAGDVFNTAVYLKREAPDAAVAFVTRIGEDRLSDRMLRRFEDEGLETGLVLRHPTRMPGLYAISTDAGGERSFMYWREVSAARALFEPPGLDLAALERVDLLYLSAITLAILPRSHRDALLDWLPELRAHGGRVAFDSNHRPALWPDVATARDVVARAWAVADIGLPSLDDELALFGEADEAAVLRRLARAGVAQGALKRGARGPVALDGAPGGTFASADRVVDSTAAGDSFNAGWLAAWLAGRPSEERLAAGHALARRVVGVRGAILPREGGA